MNLSDSIKIVIKHKSQDIFGEIWRHDLKRLLLEIADDVSYVFKSGKVSFKKMKSRDYKTNFKEMVDSGADTLLIFKVLPGRMREGFNFFKEDLYQELENQKDSKKKAIFSLKIFGALASFTVGSFYGMKRGAADFSLTGLRRKNAFTQFIVAEIIFKLSQLFIQRFLSEVEKEISDPTDLKNLRYFKELISNRSKLEALHEEKSSDINHRDRAIEIVDNLRNYIMTGKRR